MFKDCKSLTTISSLSNWDVSNGKDFSRMFAYCKSLKNISALQNWNVSNAQSFYNMFGDCYSLIAGTILNTWNVSNVKYFNGMFHDCYSLKEIHLPDTLCKLRINMFQDCNPKLKIHWKNKIYTYEDLQTYEYL